MQEKTVDLVIDSTNLGDRVVRNRAALGIKWGSDESFGMETPILRSRCQTDLTIQRAKAVTAQEKETFTAVAMQRARISRAYKKDKKMMESVRPDQKEK